MMIMTAALKPLVLPALLAASFLTTFYGTAISSDPWASRIKKVSGTVLVLASLMAFAALVSAALP